MAGASYLVVAFFFGLAGGFVGRAKGSSFVLWFLISMIVPVIGLIAALAYRWDRDEPRRQCPQCGSLRKIHDAMCTNCGAELEFPDQVLPPESAVRRS